MINQLSINLIQLILVKLLELFKNIDEIDVGKNFYQLLFLFSNSNACNLDDSEPNFQNLPSKSVQEKNGKDKKAKGTKKHFSLSKFIPKNMSQKQN